MHINQKELVLLPYPFSDLEGTKVRPAIVVSNNSFNKKSADCIMVPLTTVIKNEPCSVIIDQQNMASGRLMKQSRVRADKIFAVEKRLVSMKIGTITDKTFEKIKAEIFRMF
ncbi:MAG TPA: type II toxin-antitoxin system PemK/MazF family toxin [Candidatus Nanoarchaeia archaeon]|nr:type II toxin-antitoxin system PemK/MazF family toxin [Candidatus Nanoarchaeia archaeon]